MLGAVTGMPTQCQLIQAICIPSLPGDAHRAPSKQWRAGRNQQTGGCSPTNQQREKHVTSLRSAGLSFLVFSAVCPCYHQAPQLSQP